MDNVKEKSCKNCELKNACLLRWAAIHTLYIATGRSDELTDEVKENFCVSEGCNVWEEAIE